jgi:glycosyltransferase involved in cell wall biosynthesis
MGRPMIDTLIVVKSNNYGLTRDAQLLASALADAGVKTEVAGIHDRPLLDRALGRRRARRIIHVERVFPQWVGAAEVNVLIPNQERFPRRHLGRLRRIDLILAKTHEAASAFAGHGVPVEYLGFTSEDRFDARVSKDWNRVLHLAGGSTLKGTEDVLALWERHPEWPELVLVQKRQNAPSKVPANIRLISDYTGDEDLRQLQNECGIHLCPSRSEGWGHNLVEGMSCGTLVITTDAPPMNEHVRAAHGMLVSAPRTEPRHMGTCHFVDMDALEATVGAAIAMPASRKAEMGELARKRFLEIDRAFRERVSRLLAA